MSNYTDKDATFLARLVSLLNSDVRVKSKEAVEAEETCNAIRWELTRCFEETHRLDALPDDFTLSEFLEEHVNAPLNRIKEQIEKPWLKDKLTIGLLGHFSTGKTTAINLILSENLPTNEDENTALAAFLIQGGSNEMSIVTKSGQTLVLKEEDSKALDYADGKKKFPFARVFNYVVKENASSLLSSLTFIDTPGLGKKMEHSEPTLEALNSCDAVIWFVKTVNSISKSDIGFIKENISDKGKTLYIVCSFIDDCENPDRAISVIKSALKKDNINVEDYFFLGYDSLIKDKFRNTILKALNEAAKKHEVYNPYAHLYNVISYLEKILIQYKQYTTQEYNKLDKETDNLIEAYQRSRQVFVTEFNTCCRIMGNVVDTFNKRCASAAFCGGASGAISNLLNSYSNSFNKMSNADDAVDVKKLVEFGQKTAGMNLYEIRSKQAAEILERIQKLKKAFD